MEKEMKRSKYWNELVEVLEQEFPKGECKERGGALVLLSYAEMALQKQKAELEKAVREETLQNCWNEMATMLSEGETAENVLKGWERRLKFLTK